MTQQYVTNNKNTDENEIDLLQLFHMLWVKKWFILIFVITFTCLSVIFGALKQSSSIYEADALIQIEGSASLPTLPTGFGDSSNSGVSTEIELIKSRTVLSQVVQELNLDIHTALDRSFIETISSSFQTFVNDKQIFVSIFKVPEPALGTQYQILVKEAGAYELISPSGITVLSGHTGALVSSVNTQLKIDRIAGLPGDIFSITKLAELDATEVLRKNITVSLQGASDSGILRLRYQHVKPLMAKVVLQKILDVLIKLHIARNSLEVKNSLEFLHTQLPLIEKTLEKSESRFNNYQKSKDTIDIKYESRTLLNEINLLNNRIQELKDSRLNLSRKYKAQHPSIQNIKKQISYIESQKRNLQNQLKKLPDTQQKLVQLNRQVEVGTNTYMQLLSKTQELELEIVKAATSRNIRIIDEAVVKRTPVKQKKTKLFAALGAVLGLMFGILIVLAIKFFNNRLESFSDLDSLDLPVFSVIPHSPLQSKTSKFTDGNFMLSVNSPQDVILENFRSLRTSLHFAMLEEKNNIIVISGATPNVGKSFVSSNLATITAQGNKKTLLIDADLRKGHLHKSFKLQGDIGLSSLLSNTATYEEIIHSTGIDNLDFIPRGEIPPNPADLLMNDKLKGLIDRIKNAYDLIIIDTPPILTVTDATLIAKHACATLIVCRYKETSVQEVISTKQKLQQNGIQINGVIFNDSKIKTNKKYNYY